MTDLPRKLLLVGMSAGLGGAVFAGLRLLDSKHALLALPGGALLLGVALLLDRIAPRTAPGPAPPIIPPTKPPVLVPAPPPSRGARGTLPSLHAELVAVRDVARERRICARCSFTIRHEREGDLCWIAVRRRGDRTVLVHYHVECADELGDPLP